MRLIDADELLKALQYNTKTLIGEIRDVNSLVAVDVNTMIGYIEKMPTAYDVGAVVAEIKKSPTDDDGLFVSDGNEPMIWKSKAISIVRGKE